MRGSDLLGAPVVSRSGAALGRVLDVRLVQDGPLLGAFAAMRVEGLVVGHRRTSARLGYDRVEAHGPLLVATVVRWLARDNRYLPWEQASLEGHRVVSGLDELLPVPFIT
ncbi:MAG: hypothetical protein QOD70_2165 [Frankiales bacterium]|nr:hypothetical protein [Frankiales bacterium]